MSNLVKNRKKDNVNPKTIIFWSIIGLISLTLIVTVIVLFVNNMAVNSKKDLKYLEGNEIYLQEESKYYVLVYDFDVENSEDNDDFEKVVLNYQSFLKKYLEKSNGSSVTAYKLYAVDSADPDNYKAITSGKNEQIENTTAVTDSFLGENSDALLRIPSSKLPVILTIENKKVTSYEDGISSISKFLQDIIDSYVVK